MGKLIIALIRFYQKTLSPDHGPGFFGFSAGCRFYPSCSEYSAGVIQRYGLIKGGLKSLFRILKCGPWSGGGYDPVKQ